MLFYVHRDFCNLVLFLTTRSPLTEHHTWFESYFYLLCKHLGNGGYTEWTQWSTCTRTCGSGSHTRTRACTNPSPLAGGLTCIQQGLGGDSETEQCNTNGCERNHYFVFYRIHSNDVIFCSRDEYLKFVLQQEGSKILYEFRYPSAKKTHDQTLNHWFWYI